MVALDVGCGKREELREPWAGKLAIEIFHPVNGAFLLMFRGWKFYEPETGGKFAGSLSVTFRHGGVSLKKFTLPRKT